MSGYEDGIRHVVARAEENETRVTCRMRGEGSALEALADWPVGTLTPSGRYRLAGEGDDAWITSRWVIGQGDVR